MAPISKGRISAPMEAGASFLDTQKLAPQIMDALDYVSAKLIGKKIHLTLMVVRTDGQRPCSPPPSSSLFSPLPPPTPFSPFSAAWPASPTLSTISRQSTYSVMTTVTPSTPSFPMALTRYPKINASPPSSTPPPELTVLHTSTLSPKAARHLHTTIAKASKKFTLPPTWLRTTSTLAAAPPKDLIHRSLLQNSILFTSEGLTLLNLDRVFTFKLALSVYSKSLSSSAPIAEIQHALREAVDELRLLIISVNGRRVDRAFLLRSYDHLKVGLEALRIVNELHREWFGGVLPISGLGEKVARSETPHKVKEVRKEERRDRREHLAAVAVPVTGGRVTPRRE